MCVKEKKSNKAKGEMCKTGKTEQRNKKKRAKRKLQE
jgi:hypothetical protein